MRRTKTTARARAKKRAIGPGVYPKQSQKIEMPKIEPTPHIEVDFAGSLGFSKHMDWRTTSFLCKLEWSWSPMNERMESYYLQRRRKHWVLWIKRYDDNWQKWDAPIAIARCPRVDEDHKAAAMILLAGSFTEEIRQYDNELDRYTINDTGSLSMEDLDAVADSVWGKESK
jgi:hypothetical protein